MIHPCCGHSLQKATKLIAYIDMGVAVFSVILFGFLVIFVLGNGTEIQPSPTPTTAPGSNSTNPVVPDVPAMSGMAEGTILMMFLLAICYNAGIFYLSRFLFYAAIARDYERVHQWFVIALALLVIRICFYFMGIAFSMALGSLWGVFGFIYQVYSIYVVYCFREELDLAREDETVYLRRAGLIHQEFKI